MKGSVSSFSLDSKSRLIGEEAAAVVADEARGGVAGFDFGELRDGELGPEAELRAANERRAGVDGGEGVVGVVSAELFFGGDGGNGCIATPPSGVSVTTTGDDSGSSEAGDSAVGDALVVTVLVIVVTAVICIMDMVVVVVVVSSVMSAMVSLVGDAASCRPSGSGTSQCRSLTRWNIRSAILFFSMTASLSCAISSRSDRMSASFGSSLICALF